MSKRFLYQFASLITITRPLTRRAVIFQPRGNKCLNLPPLGIARKGRKR